MKKGVQAMLRKVIQFLRYSSCLVGYLKILVIKQESAERPFSSASIEDRKVEFHILIKYYNHYNRLQQ